MKNKVLIAIVLLIFVSVIAIPCCVYFAYSIEAPSWLQPLWEAPAALAYFGSVLAGVATVIGVYYSLLASDKRHDEEIVKSVQPFLASSILKKEYVQVGLFTDYEDCFEPRQIEVPPNEYSEHRVDKLFFNIGQNVIEPMAEITPKEMQIIRQRGAIQERHRSGYALHNYPVFDHTLAFENVGKAAAIRVKFGVYREDDEKNKKLSLPLSLKVGDSVSVLIYCIDYKPKNKNEKFILECIYSDIYGNGYMQQYPIEASKTNDNEVLFSVDTTDLQQKH